MRARADVSCVVHTHAMPATAFAATGQPLRPISHDGTLFVPPDIARFTETGDLISTAELGRALVGCLGERNALLLPNHGLVATGASVPEGVMTAVLLVKACQAQLMAGTVRHWSPDEEALAKREHCWPARNLERGWDYFVRRVRRSRA
jgi:ribulose-5-phosphate 4-epimerase/fuculose-1-phosphate aldolase